MIDRAPNRPRPVRRGRPALYAAMVGFAAVATASCGDVVAAAGPPEGTDLAILFVGNSLTYTNDLPGIVGHLLATYGGVGEVHVESVAYPNYGLEDHWNEGTARALIAAGGWDVVAVQQGPSATEGRPSLIEFSGRFADEVEAQGGRLAVYMVWPSLARSFDFDGVSDAHRTAAEQADGLLFPAGEAWRAAWAVDADLALYGGDGFHPSALGTYLAALVIFEQLSGRAPSTLPDGMVRPGGVTPLPDGVTEVLHEAAAAANRDFGLGSAR